MVIENDNAGGLVYVSWMAFGVCGSAGASVGI